MSEEQAETYAITEPHVNISIHMPGMPHAELSALATGRQAALFIAFHDYDKVCLNGHPLTPYGDAGTIQCITPEQARQIVDFFRAWQGKVNLVVVNCAAGISRSSATAAALAVVAFQEDDFIFCNKKYHPNMLVYRMILKEAFKLANDE